MDTASILRQEGEPASNTTINNIVPSGAIFDLPTSPAVVAREDTAIYAFVIRLYGCVRYKMHQVRAHHRYVENVLTTVSFVEMKNEKLSNKFF